MTDIAIKIEHLNYVYSPGTAYEKHALKDICLEIPHGEFVGMIGEIDSDPASERTCESNGRCAVL